MTSCGATVAGLLEQMGADTVFGIPGVHTLEVYRGLSDSSLRHIAPRHEQGAGFMADGWARVTGSPGVCILISGPGVTNAITPIAQAYQDSIPLLVISGVVPAANRRRGEIHDLPDQQALMATVTAFSQTIEDPAELPGAFDRAAAVWSSARPRPVHIEIPVDVMSAPAGPGATLAPAPAPPAPDAQALARAASLLAGAERPLVLLGGGARDAGAAAEAIAEALDAPIALTINARGTVDHSHPLCLGSAISFPPLDAFLREADAVLLVGAELSDLELWGLDAPLTLSGVVRVDIDPAQLGARYPSEVDICGDAGEVLGALRELLGDRADRREPAAAARVASGLAALAPPESLTRFSGLVETLDRVLPANRLIAADSTQPAYAANHLLPMHEPRSWLMPIGYGCLGCAMPMAIGAKLARPDAPVVALAGDGGFMFTVQELATARENGLALPVLVYNNRGYGEIRDAMDEARVPHLGTDVQTHDIPAIARGFGCAGIRVRSMAELADAISRALAAAAPTVIEFGDLV